MNRSQSELMVHQLPSDCYPPTDSDDESFVVLERSLAPDYAAEAAERRSVLQTFSPEEIDRSIEVATDLLSCVTSLSPTPKAPSLTQPDLSFTSDLSPDEVQQKVLSLIDENSDLKRTLSQNNMVMKNQYDTLIQWQKDVERVQESHKKKFAETKIYIMKLKEENSRLANLLKQGNSSFVAIPDNAKLEEQEKIIKKLTAELENERQALMSVNTQESMVEVKIKEKEDIIDKLSAELENEKQAVKVANEKLVEMEKEMQKRLSDQELEFDKKQQSLLEQITALKVLSENLQANLGVQEETDKLRSQLMASQAALTDIKQAKKALEKEMEAKLQAVLTKTNEATERNDILEQQLLLYKTDFESERECKNKAIIDKNQLVEDLQDMQRRNTQLLEEVETLRAKSTFVEVSTQQRASAPPQQEPFRRPSLFSCPRCNFGFHNFQALENHVYRCIELDALP